MVLEVVPSEGETLDVITMNATAGPSAAETPSWSVGGSTPAPTTGWTTNFDAFAPDPLVSWDPTAEPNEYQVSAQCADGCSREMQVHAYPPGALDWDIHPDETFAGVREFKDAVLAWLEEWFEIDGWDLDIANGELTLDAQWKEHTDHRAYYAYDIVSKFDPLFYLQFDGTDLIGGRLIKFAVRLKKMKFITKILEKIKKVLDRLPARVRKYFDDLMKLSDVVEADFALIVELTIKVDSEFHRNSPDQPLLVEDSGAGTTFSGGIDGSASASVPAPEALERWGIEELINVEIGISAALEGTGVWELGEEDALRAHLTVSSAPLMGSFKLSFIDGEFEVADGEETELIEGTEIWDGSMTVIPGDYNQP